jgi:hypothetical protein
MKIKIGCFIGFTVLFMSTFKATVAQNLYVKDALGVPVNVAKTENTIGSPYLLDDWTGATVKLKKGVTYKENMYVKFDLEKNVLYFKGQDGQTLAFVDPVSEFVLSLKGTDAYFRNGYQNVPDVAAEHFIQVLNFGTVQLVKVLKAFTVESSDYGSGVKQKNYEKSSKYYLIKGKDIKLIKPDRKALLLALADKQSQIESYVKSNNVNFKSDADLGKLITFYNSI